MRASTLWRKSMTRQTRLCMIPCSRPFTRKFSTRSQLNCCRPTSFSPKLTLAWVAPNSRKPKNSWLPPTGICSRAVRTRIRGALVMKPSSPRKTSSDTPQLLISPSDASLWPKIGPKHTRKPLKSWLEEYTWSVKSMGQRVSTSVAHTSSWDNFLCRQEKPITQRLFIRKSCRSWKTS